MSSSVSSTIFLLKSRFMFNERCLTTASFGFEKLCGSFEYITCCSVELLSSLFPSGLEQLDDRIASVAIVIIDFFNI